MAIDELIHRLRSYFTSRGMNTRKVAIASGLNWRSVEGVLRDGGNPTLETIRRLEAIVPPEFTAPDAPRNERAA